MTEKEIKEMNDNQLFDYFVDMSQELKFTIKLHNGLIDELQKAQKEMLKRAKEQYKRKLN